MLRRPEPLEALLAALEGVERLVLLGDTVELLEGRPRQAMDVAEPVLRALGSRLGGSAEVIVVPGNHDRALVRPWVLEHDATMGLDTAVPIDAAPALAQLASWLEAGAGCASTTRACGSRRASGRPTATTSTATCSPRPPTASRAGCSAACRATAPSPADYERAGGPSATRLEALMTRWLPRPLAVLTDELADVLRAATMPGGPRRALGRRLAPIAERTLGTQMRRASIPALARVVHRLGVGAEWVVFGHVHRCGPLAGDDPRQWRGPGGSPSIANTGSWVYEPLLLHHVSAPHPYWPGGAIRLRDGGAPEAIGLLDHLDAATLHGRPPD